MVAFPDHQEERWDRAGAARGLLRRVLVPQGGGVATMVVGGVLSAAPVRRDSQETDRGGTSGEAR